MRTLLGRVLLVVLSVALLAVVATAFVADRIARDDLDEALSRDFEAEQVIYSELATYALFNGSWEGVDEVVDELADEFDERVALTDLDGRVLADSAQRADGGAPALPPQEVAFVDPFGDAAFIDGASQLDSPFLEEIDAEALTDCLDRLGVPYELVDDGMSVVPFLSDPMASVGLEDEISECFVQSSGVIVEFEDPFVEVEPGLLYLGEGSGEGSGLLTGGPDWRLLALIVAVAFPAALITWLAVRAMFAPLRSIESAARAVGAGDLGARAQEGGVDELAELAAQFNDMAVGLEAEDQRRRQFTSDIAHELRTPLANIRGYLEAAQDGMVATDAELVASLHEDTILLQDLVEDLQTLNQADAGALTLVIEDLALAEVVRGAVASHQAAARAAAVDVRADVPSDLVVAADRRRMRQVLGNLLTNAVRHSAPGDRVRVTARTTADQVVVSVIDRGEGISEEDLGRVFERFARVDSSRNRTTGGSGLGLAISRQLVEAMGGRLLATSTEGSGSVFEIWLPRHPPGQAANSTPER